MPVYLVDYCPKAKGACQQCKETIEEVRGLAGSAARGAGRRGRCCWGSAPTQAAGPPGIPGVHAVGDHALPHLQGDLRLGTQSENAEGKLSTRWKHW